MNGRYRALLIGNSTYTTDEHNLLPLKGPVKDIAALNRALVDPATGMFVDENVTLLAEVGWAKAIRTIGRFFADGSRDDVLLFYYSGHGKLDQAARLHLCMSDTDTTDLLATAVSSARINEFVEFSRAATVLIILDCCHAGAFRGGTIAGALAGPGSYVLSSCRGTQLANDATADNGTSYFTQFLVDGLLGAAIDSDGDGWLGFSDLYRFVDRRLRTVGKQLPHQQTPQQRIQGDGELVLARRPNPLSAAPSGPTLATTMRVPAPSATTGSGRIDGASPGSGTSRHGGGRFNRREVLLSSIATAAVFAGGGVILTALPPYKDTADEGSVPVPSESSTPSTTPSTARGHPPTRSPTRPPSSSGAGPSSSKSVPTVAPSRSIPGGKPAATVGNDKLAPPR